MKLLRPQYIPLMIQNGYLVIGSILLLLYLLTYNISLDVFFISVLIGYAHAHSISIFYHRYLVHHAFEVNRWINYIGSTFACLYNGGSPYTWRSIHYLHHKFADTKRDPHSPENSMSIFKHMLYVSSNDMFHHKVATKDVKWMKGTTDGYHVFLHDYGHYIKVAYSLFLLFGFGFEIMMIVHILPIILSTFSVALTNILAHSKIPFSYKPNDNTKDRAHNNFLLGTFMTAGEGWHYNHHKYPGRANFGEKWWQIDTSYFIIKLIEKK